MTHSETIFETAVIKGSITFSSVASGCYWVSMVDCLLKYVFRRSAFSSSESALVVSSIRVSIGAETKGSATKLDII